MEDDSQGIRQTFADQGLPGGEAVDRGLRDLAAGRVTVWSLLVSLAAPRLEREGVPVPSPHPDAAMRLYALLEESEGDLAHARFNALQREIVSFANALCAVNESRAS